MRAKEAEAARLFHGAYERSTGMTWVGPAIAAGSKLIGGLFGGGSSKSHDHRMAHNEYLRQKQFAKQGTGWQMRDAVQTGKELGLHPLAAIGAAGGQSYTPAGGISSGTEGDFSFLGDAIGAGIDAHRQNKIDKQAKKESDARIAVDNAEADLIRAQSRTVIQDARRSALSGTASVRTGSNERPSVLQELIEGDKTSSGLSRADIDNPAEFEADVWAWVRNGKLGPNVRELIRRNLSTAMQHKIKNARNERERREIARAIEAQRRARWLRDKKKPRKTDDERAMRTRGAIRTWY